MNKYTKANFGSSAVVTIDVQCDTLDGQPMEVPGTSAILPRIRKILDVYRQKRMPIVHVVRIYKKNGGNVDICRKEEIENGAEMLLERSGGCEPTLEMFHPDPIRLDTGLLLSGKIQGVTPHEAIIYKPRWGAFFKTPLESHLKALRVDTLVFAGCNFPNCPRASIYEASERDFRIVLAEDAISGLYPKGKEEMQNIGVHITDADAILNAVLQQDAAPA